MLKPNRQQQRVIQRQSAKQSPHKVNLFHCLQLYQDETVNLFHFVKYFYFSTIQLNAFCRFVVIMDELIIYLDRVLNLSVS